LGFLCDNNVGAIKHVAGVLGVQIRTRPNCGVTTSCALSGGEVDHVHPERLRMSVGSLAKRPASKTEAVTLSPTKDVDQTV